jgi:UDP-3-O-[3-hydroxymyristoyl] N-acetylglucosamine deacetylase
MRRTIASSVQFRGVGLHCGAAVSMVVAPAPAGSGILFRRTDAGTGARLIPARHDAVAETRLCTRLSNKDGLSVSTVEHLMAALSGCGVTDALVSLDAPEVPVMDGSALLFVLAFVNAGFKDMPGLNPALRILEPVEVRVDGKRAALLPAPRLEMDFTVSFSDPAIGDQRRFLTLTGNAFVTELCDSRTFGLLSEVEGLRRLGLGIGGSLDNTIVVDRGRVLNPGGLRHPDEFVRHKMLDAVGDLALMGAPIIGRYVGVKAGHTLTNLLLREVFARPGAWTWTDPAAGQGIGDRLEPPAAQPDATPVAV